MGWYNSENTKVLETYEVNGNLRMLLFHECEGGRREYVVGSNFHERRYDGALGYERWDYEWDWGHYFCDVVDAVEYWKREVLGMCDNAYIVSYRRDEGDPYCANLVHADDYDAVSREFDGYDWFAAHVAPACEVREARAKGMPERWLR